MRRKIGLPIYLWLAIVLSVGIVALAGFQDYARKAWQTAKRWHRHIEAPGIDWQTASPEEEGLDAAALDALQKDMEQCETKALLVVRGNRVVHEWYARDFGPNVPHGTAAMAKAATGSIVLLVALSDGRLDLEDPASKYISAWRGDPMRSKILIRDLSSHASGLDDVEFVAGAAGILQGWQKGYYDHPAERFTRAIHDAPMLFEPGTQVKYCGLGYYILAYAVTVSLQSEPKSDIETLLRTRIMEPIGVPDSQWRLSYGESYEVDGMTICGFSSGASYTARAVARIGQLVLDRGRWNERKIFDQVWLDRLLAGCRAPPEPGTIRPGGGWWLNLNGALPSLPRDSLVGIGGNHEILLVVPSLDLVAVRMGERIGDVDNRAKRDDDDDYFRDVNDRLFAPLVQAVVGPSSRASQ